MLQRKFLNHDLNHLSVHLNISTPLRLKSLIESVDLLESQGAVIQVFNLD